MLACGGAPECPPPPTPPTLTAPQVAPVRVAARDLSLRIGPAWLHLRSVDGRLLPTQPDRPVSIDEPTTWRGVVEHAEIGVPTAALEAVLRRPGDRGVAALDGVTVRTDGARLILSGELRPGGLGFEVVAVPSPDPRGRLGVRAESVRVLGLDVERALDRADLTFADLLSLDGQRGLSVEGDTLFVEVSELSSEVALEGRVVAVAVLADGVALVLGEGAATARPVTMARVEEAVHTPHRNAVVFDGGDLRFGDIVLIDGRIEVEDIDPSDPLTADVATLSDQLRAGHSKSLPASAAVRLMLPDHDAFGPDDLARPHEADPLARAPE